MKAAGGKSYFLFFTQNSFKIQCVANQSRIAKTFMFYIYIYWLYIKVRKSTKVYLLCFSLVIFVLEAKILKNIRHRSLDAQAPTGRFT